jgi:aerobic carbon-monoxide dehydrogenase large subunit
MHQGGAALVKAAEAVIEKGRPIAAALLQADITEVAFSGGRFTVRGTEREIDLLALARAAIEPADLPANFAGGRAPGLDSYAFNISDAFTFPNGCHIADVEIDPETGFVTIERYTAVDDYGRLINPRLTEGQVQGGSPRASDRRSSSTPSTSRVRASC